MTSTPTQGAGSLAGKTALVTGGARGFGRAICHLLAEDGADVAVADLGSAGMDASLSDSAQIDSTVAELRAMGVRSIGINADVTKAADNERMAAETIDEFGKIDILVVNAGVATLGPAWELTEKEWDFVLDVNLKGAFLTTKYVVPHMIEAGNGGHIVMTASRNGLRAERGYAHYNASKAGVIMLAKSFALELGEHEIRVNAVCPTQMADRTVDGLPKTMATPEYWAQVVGKPDATYEEFDMASGRENLFDKHGQPDFRQVGEAVRWLSSPASGMVTGVALPVDAGWIAKRGG